MLLEPREITDLLSFREIEARGFAQRIPHIVDRGGAIDRQTVVEAPVAIGQRRACRAAASAE